MSMVSVSHISSDVNISGGAGDKTYACSISTNWRGKTNLAADRLGAAAHAQEFYSKSLTLKQIADAVLAGCRVAPGTFENNHRNADNLTGGLQIAGFDFDHNSVADLQSDDLFGPYSFLTHSTTSSGIVTDKNPDGDLRARAWVALSESLEPELFELFMAGMYRLSDLEGDEGTASATIGFFGSTNRAEQPVINLEAVLPPEIVNRAIAAQRRYLEAQQPVYMPYEGDDTELVSAIVSAAKSRGYKGRGKFLNGLCLFHDDKEPSAGISIETGVLNCFACGTHSPRDVADQLGIDWQRFEKPLSIAPKSLPTIEWQPPVSASDWPNGIEDQHVLLAQAAGVRNLGALFLTLAALDSREFDLYQLEQGGQQVFGDKAPSYKAWYTLAQHPLFERCFEPVTENFPDFYTIDKELWCKNTENTPTKPRLRWQMRQQAVIEAELHTAADDNNFKLAVRRGVDKLPPTLKPRLAQVLEGVSGDNVITVTEQFNAATAGLAATDPDFELGLRVFQSRYSEGSEYLERVSQATDSADEILKVSDFKGLLDKEADSHLILGSYCHRYDLKRVPDRKRTTTLDALVSGVSVPLVTRKRQNCGKYGMRELAETRYTDETRVTVDLGQPDPDTLFEQITTTTRREKGFGLYLQATGGPPVPIKRENFSQVCACAATNGGSVSLTLSVSQTMERYTPDANELQQAIQGAKQPPRRTPKQERKPTVRRKPQDVPTIVSDAFTRLMKAYGWAVENDIWTDPTGNQYDNHTPTLLDALTRQLQEDQQTMNFTQHTAAKFNQEPVTLRTVRSEPAPEPAQGLPQSSKTEQPIHRPGYEVIFGDFRKRRAS